MLKWKDSPAWQPASSISEWKNHGKIREQCPRIRDFSLSLQQLLTVSERKDAVCKGAGTFVPMTVKGAYFFPFSFFCSCACCFNNEQLARNHSDQQPCDGFLMGFLITKGYKPVLQWDWICEVSTSLCQWWLVLSVHVLQWLLTVVRNSILVILFYSEPCELDRYWSSPNVRVSAFLTPACADTITVAQPYQAIRHHQSILVTAAFPKVGWQQDACKMSLPFHSV